MSCIRQSQMHCKNMKKYSINQDLKRKNNIPPLFPFEVGFSHYYISHTRSQLWYNIDMQVVGVSVNVDVVHDFLLGCSRETCCAIVTCLHFDCQEYSSNSSNKKTVALLTTFFSADSESTDLPAFCIRSIRYNL